MSDFEVVPDELRQTGSRNGREMKAEHRALLDGQTIFVPLNGDRPFDVRNRAYGSMVRAGHRLHACRMMRDGVDGFVMWAEPKAIR